MKSYPARSSTRPARARLRLLERLERRVLCSATTAPAAVGYLPDYELADNPSLLTTLRNASFEGLTQVNYFSVLPTTGGLLPGTTVNGASNTATTTSGGYTLAGASSQLATLVTAAHAAGVKVDVVVGGGGGQSTALTGVVEAGSATWQTFAASVQQFASAHGIDGVDLDWEPSSLNGTDQANYGGLIAALKAGTTGLTLSAAVNSGKLAVSTGGAAYVLNATGVQDLTTINVMAYDLEPGNVSPTGEAESALAGWNSYVTSSGGNLHQVNFGMPFYGTSGTTWANTVADQYGDLLAKYAAANAGALPAPTASSLVLKKVTWNYNGPSTIAAKAAYALDAGDGGVVAWEVGQDYFTAAGAYDATDSLLPQFARATAANTGTIAGTVVTTAGAAVQGQTLYLDLNGNGQPDAGELTAVTNAAGQYTFSNLLIGTYVVRQELATGYAQASPAAGAGASVTATAGGAATANFTVTPPPAATTLTLTAAGSGPSTAVQAVSFTATVTGGVPDGETVALEDASHGNAVVATATLAGGSATLTAAAGTLPAGTHNLFAAYAGDATLAASNSATVVQTVQVVATAAVVNGNLPALAGAQRSMVDGVVYTFSEPVFAAAGAFTIAVHGGQVGTVPTLTWTALSPAADGSSTQWAVTFTGSGVIGNSIGDGVYDLTMNAAAVTSAAAGVALQTRATDTFSRLYGDYTGAGRVNAADYNYFLSTYGLKSTASAYLAAFDHGGVGGKIDASDYNYFLANYGLRYTGFTPTI